jgi:hypothetical protein
MAGNPGQWGNMTALLNWSMQIRLIPPFNEVAMRAP